MSTRPNPFHEIYLTENSSPEKFIEIFSPALVKDALALFQPGNVVLMGIQGTGKSALLNLLKPEQRIAYSEANDSNNSFPVPQVFSKFICGGINLTRSGAIDFGQRHVETQGQQGDARIPAYFADFLNYWIVRDILQSCLMLAGHPKTCEELGLAAFDDTSKVNRFAKIVAEKECWGGYLAGVETLETLEKRLNYRIQHYRDFLNFNIDVLDKEVQTTKTSAGIPISVFAETLAQCELIPSDLSVFVRIDQYEELDRLEDWSDSHGLFESYKGVVNKMLGARDPHISYRIGTRRHAWDPAPKVFGTATIIEEFRNFRIIDIDELLRRKENRPWMFPAFAEDVFQRRAKLSNYVIEKNQKSYLATFFGKTGSPPELAKLYSSGASSYGIKIEDKWPQEYKDYLLDLSHKSPYEGRLAEAWLRQKGGSADFDLNGWRAKPWWIKERRGQSLMQLASSQRQKLLWFGMDDVLNLSGGNILVFVSLCQFVWDAWLRTDPIDTNFPLDQALRLPSVDDVYIQDEGIQQASSYWFRKLRADPDGDSRQRFVALVAAKLRDRLVNDRNMSYPGENGFSLARRELDDHKLVSRFLDEASAFGALYDRRHTSKNKHRGESTKWYLNPILSPYFQLPAGHTKEPYYAHVYEVVNWLVESKALSSEESLPRKKNEDKHQRDLFGG